MRIDDDIANTEWLLRPFKHIHPNFISLFGMICNIFIIKYLLLREIYLANIFLAIRYFCDILDGAVARRYNKTSKLGGYLDTIDDIMLLTLYLGLIIWIKTKNILYTKLGFFISLLILVAYLKSYNALYDHTNLKQGGTSKIEKILEFFINNSLFIWMFIFYMNIKLLYK
jgi:phosphatidylglycerophosphate synthase